VVNHSIFREYDIRGIFDEELSHRRVSAIGYFLGLKSLKYGGRVAVGYDARTHSPVLFDWLSIGIESAGADVIDIGMVSTPVAYFSVFQQVNGEDINNSIMITGSHNPPEYNGFKITINKKPFFGKDIEDLRKTILNSEDISLKSYSHAQKFKIKDDYIDFLVKEFEHLKGFDKKIYYDCGNGVASIVVKELFERLEFDAKGIFLEPDGTFPNHHPDPTVEENLKDIKNLIKDEPEAVAFAYDGDADRLAVLTSRHNIKGDILAILFAKNMKNPTIIGEVKCSQVMYDEINKLGKCVMYKTGHSNLKVMLAKLGADLACEVSGHIFFNDRYFGYDDAIYATLRVIELMANGIDLNKEVEALPKLYSTDEIKVKTSEIEKFRIVSMIKDMLKNPPPYIPKIKEIIDIDGVRIVFEDGFGLVRASNTTPILVTRFEANSKERAKEYENAVNRLILEAKAKVCE
jgi:phosphomannomutase/phosphoglucomutase